MSTHGIESVLQHDLRRLVESLYGPTVRRLPGLEVGRAYRGSAREFRYGGDLVDVFRYENGSVSIAIVHITGHGIRAAMHAGLARYALRAYCSTGCNAEDSIRSLNRLYIENSAFEGPSDFYATVFFGIIDEARHTLQYVSAGHEAAYLIAAETTTVLGTTGPLVGLVDDRAVFVQASESLPDDCTIVAVTDGFTEARDASGAFLAADAVVEVIRKNRGQHAETQAEALIQYASDYAAGDLRDDVAALVVRVAPERLGPP